MKKNLRGFTLVEVLIVIIIVGILIAALLPRLIGSQARARDTARAAHLNQIGQAAALFQADNSTLQLSGCSNTALLDDYLASRPLDPTSQSVATVGCPAGTYPILRDADGANWVIADMEQAASSNCTPTLVASGTVFSVPAITPNAGTHLCYAVRG